MKKILFSVFAVVAVSLFCTSICVANNKMDATASTMVATSARTVIVQKISGPVVYSKKLEGIYDGNANTLTIEGTTHSVNYNPDYNKTKAARGKYEYCAGSIYYFNL